MPPVPPLPTSPYKMPVIPMFDLAKYWKCYTDLWSNPMQAFTDPMKVWNSELSSQLSWTAIWNRFYSLTLAGCSSMVHCAWYVFAEALSYHHFSSAKDRNEKLVFMQWLSGIWQIDLSINFAAMMCGWVTDGSTPDKPTTPEAAPKAETPPKQGRQVIFSGMAKPETAPSFSVLSRRSGTWNAREMWRVISRSTGRWLLISYRLSEWVERISFCNKRSDSLWRK